MNAYKTVDEYKKLDEMVEDIYLHRIKEKHPTFTRKKLKRLMDKDCYLSAYEAVELGLADKVM